MGEATCRARLDRAGRCRAGGSGARRAPPSHGEPLLLCRNVHRLEKGLIIRPRRDVFAADHLGETVESFASRPTRGAAGGEDEREMRWAGEGLGSYFAAVGAGARVDATPRRRSAGRGCWPWAGRSDPGFYIQLCIP